MESFTYGVAGLTEEELVEALQRLKEELPPESDINLSGPDEKIAHLHLAISMHDVATVAQSGAAIYLLKKTTDLVFKIIESTLERELGGSKEKKKEQEKRVTIYAPDGKAIDLPRSPKG